MLRTLSARATRGGARLCEHVLSVEATGSRPGEEPHRARGQWQAPSRRPGSLVWLETPSAARPAGPAPGLRSSIAGQPPLSQSAEAAPPYPRTPASGQTHPAAQGARPEPSYKVPTFYSSLPFAVLEKLLFYPFPQKHVISNRRLTAHAASSQLLKSLGHFREHKGLRRQTLRTAGSTAQSP